MLIGASWPWNLSTVPTRAAAGSSRLIAPTWALYGATMRTSSQPTGPRVALRVDPVMRALDQRPGELATRVGLGR